MDPRLDEAVRCARSGDPRAFRTLADAFGPDLIRFLTFFLRGDVHAAHDVAQDVFLRAWDAMDEMTDARHLRRWCYRVARCKAVTWLRRRGPRGLRIESLDVWRQDPEATAPEGPPPARVDLDALDEGLERSVRGTHAPSDPWHVTPLPREGDDLLHRLRDAMRRLPANYAGPVQLHYMQGYDTYETARLLGITRDTVKTRLYRARCFLRRELDREAARRRWHRITRNGTGP
ncbi:MAG: RNA polymerase sigma factor [Planctomycetota bacterium]